MVSLKKQAIKSIKWTTYQTIFVGSMGPVLLIIKARFLSPEEFGYLAIVLIFIGLFQLLEKFGISQAIIQRDEISVQEASTIFYFNIAFTFIAAAVLYAASPFIADFFSLPNITEYLRISCLILLITGPSILFRALLQKDMHFKQLSLISIVAKLIHVSLTTYFLILGLGVLSIIYASIIGTFFTTVIIIAVSIQLNIATISIYFNPMKILPFLRFGLFVSAKDFFTFITHRLDEIIIAYFLSSEILGIYHFGKKMLLTISTLITNSFAKVLFPVLSKLKHNPQNLTSAYYSISRFIAFGSFPFFSGIAVTAHLFVPLIFGEQWNESVIIFQIFSIASISLVLTANVATSLLYSKNKPDLVLYIDLIANSIYIISLLLLAIYGMFAVLVSYSLFFLYKSLILQYYANKQLISGFTSYLRELYIPSLSSFVMVTLIIFFQFISHSLLESEMKLAGSVIIGILSYCLMSWIFAQEILMQIKSAIMKGEILTNKVGI